MKKTEANIALRGINIFARACVRVLSREYALIGQVYSNGLIIVLVLLSTASLLGFAIETKAKKGQFQEPSLRQSFQNSGVSQRLEALDKVRSVKKSLDVTELKSLRQSEQNGLIRYRLNQTLAESGLSDNGNELINSLKIDTDPTVRQGAAQSLGNFVQNAAVVDALADQLEKEKEPSVRFACALSLGLSKSLVAVAALEKASSDSNSDLRRQVAFSLSRINTPQAKKILKKLSHDKDESVRKMAEGGLR